VGVVDMRGATVLSGRLESSQAPVQGLQPEYRANLRVRLWLATNGNDSLKVHLKLIDAP
jgi:hypothetical protein